MFAYVFINRSRKYVTEPCDQLVDFHIKEFKTKNIASAKIFISGKLVSCQVLAVEGELTDL